MNVEMATGIAAIKDEVGDQSESLNGTDDIIKRLKGHDWLRGTPEAVAARVAIEGDLGKSQLPAAVLVAITDHASHPEVILTQRSAQLTHHGGEVSFPGGLWEPGDVDLIATALRESEEETALPPSVVDICGVMPARYTRRRQLVVPVVGIVPYDLVLRPNLGELDAIFKVPLTYFADDPRAYTDVFQIGGQRYRIPAYQIEQYLLWGFTAGTLVSLLRRVLNMPFHNPQQAPDRVRR